MITINLISILKWYSIIVILISLTGLFVKDALEEEFDIGTIISIIIFLPIFIYLLIK